MLRAARSVARRPAAAHGSTAACRFNSTVSFDYKPIETYLVDGPANNGTATMDKDEAMLFHYNMYIVRRTEIAADNMYKSRLIRGFCHLYDGQVRCRNRR